MVEYKSSHSLPRVWVLPLQHGTCSVFWFKIFKGGSW